MVALYTHLFPILTLLVPVLTRVPGVEFNLEIDYCGEEYKAILEGYAQNAVKAVQNAEARINELQAGMDLDRKNWPEPRYGMHSGRVFADFAFFEKLFGTLTALDAMARVDRIQAHIAKTSTALINDFYRVHIVCGEDWLDPRPDANPPGFFDHRPEHLGGQVFRSGVRKHCDIDQWKPDDHMFTFDLGERHPVDLSQPLSDPEIQVIIVCPKLMSQHLQRPKDIFTEVLETGKFNTDGPDGSLGLNRIGLLALDKFWYGTAALIQEFLQRKYFNDWVPGDYRFGYYACERLAVQDPTWGPQNADSITLFILGLSFRETGWSEDGISQRLQIDNPGPLRSFFLIDGWEAGWIPPYLNALRWNFPWTPNGVPPPPKHKH